MDGDNKYECDRCNRKTAADRSVALRTLPPVLLVSLNRFEYDMLTAQRRKVYTSHTSVIVHNTRGGMD